MNKIHISQSIKVLAGVIVVSAISFPIAASAVPLGSIAPPPPTPSGRRIEGRDSGSRPWPENGWQGGPRQRPRYARGGSGRL